MEDNLNSVNAGQGANVEPQNTGIQSEPVNAGTQGVTNQGTVQQGITQQQGQSQSQTQTPEMNAIYASIRRQAENQTKDAVIRELSGGQFNSWAEYQGYIQQQQEAAQAQQMGIDPALLSRFNSLESELTSLRQEREAAALANDSVHGEYYKQWENEIKQLAQAAGCSIRAAYTAVLESKLPSLINGLKTAGQQDAITKLTQTAQTSPGALGGEPAGAAKSIENMSQKEFDDLMDRVKRGEKITL